MDDIRLISESSSSSILKPVHSPVTGNRQQTDSTSLIQQSDVSSSRPALLAHDALGPLLFEALDGFFFTINHNCELDFVSDNVGQYLNFSQEELAGRNLYHCVHPSDVGEFSKAWAKKDAGDPLTPTANSDQQNGQSRGRTFLCRMRTNDEINPYITMVVSVALHRDSSGSDKTFLICIARRPPINELKDKPGLLGFDQFSSRINLQYDIESLDSSHMKFETIDMNFSGKNFRDYVHTNDIPLIIRHFQDVTEKGEGKSSIYRFCLHDDIYAFVNTQSKLFSNNVTGKSESIVSTHTIVRLIDNINDLNGTASTRLMKSIITSNRDLQKNKQQSNSNKILTPPPTATPPIGAQFAFTMLGMHKNAPNSLQQHVSNTLVTLSQVQNSLSAPNSSPNDKAQQQLNIPSPPTTINAQKSSTLDNVSSSDTVEFGSKRTTFSPSLNSVHSNHGSVSSPINSFDLLFTPVSPSNDLNSLLPPTSSPLPPPPPPPSSSSSKKSSSPLQLVDPTSLLFSNSDIYTTSSSPIPPPSNTSSIPTSNQSRSSTRLRQLLATKSPPSTSASPHYHNETKSHTNTFDDLIQVAESPTTTHLSPLPNDIPSPSKQRRRNHSQTNGNSSDMLLKQILGRQAPLTTTSTDITTSENPSIWSSPGSASAIKTESVHSDDSSSNTPGGTNKLRSDMYLRTLLNEDVRPQKVIVEAPFAYNSRHKSNQRGSGGTNQLLGTTNTRTSLKSQLSLQTLNTRDWAETKGKKKQRQHSHSFGSKNNTVTKISPQRKPGRPKRDPQDYLLSNPPQSNISENSLDSFFESSTNIESTSAPIALRRPTRQTSASNTNTTVNLKRLVDNDDSIQNPRKLPKLLQQALKEDVKIECQDHSIISPSVAMAATRPLNQLTQQIIKTEPDIFDRNIPFDKTSSSLKRSINNNNNNNSTQSTLLRSLIRNPQIPTLTTKKDAPLYDLLQNLDANDSSIFSSSNNNNNNNNNNNSSTSSSIDPLEQYLTPAISQTTKISSTKDDYLAALLSSDPQQPKEISFLPINKQQTPILTRTTSTSSESSRIAAIVNDLFASTTAANVTNTTVNSSNDDFLTLLDNRDFLECLNDPTTIDSILSQNSTSIMDTSFTSTTPKRTEKDEKAISEIYKTLVTSFNPGPSSLDLSIDHSPFSSITGDFLFAENSSMSIPPNRTVTNDPSLPPYRQQQQQQATYSYQPPPQQQAPSSNTSQFPDCLSLDMLDNNSFPPNVSLSPSNNSYLSSTGTPHMDTNSMMMYNQQTPTHIQHHQNQNPMSNLFYRQSSQTQQQQQQPTMYNNFVQPPPPPPPNQVAPNNYYPMQPQSSSQQQQRMSPATHPSPLNKRQTLIHHHQQQQQQQQQRISQQNNLQLHMSTNVSLPNMTSNQQSSQQQQQQQHRPMMNTYNDLMMPNGAGPSLQQDFHRFSPSLSNTNTHDLPFTHDIFMSPPPSQQQIPQNRHMNIMQNQQSSSIPLPQATMHQQYTNMNVALPTTIQQNSHNSNNLMNPSIPNLTPAECRQSEELSNQMMNCLSYQPARCTSEFVRKQLQNTIHGRQKPAGGKDLSGGGAVAQKMMNSPNLDSNQKGAYFRSQLSSQMSTPPLQTNIRSQQQPSKTTM